MFVKTDILNFVSKVEKGFSSDTRALDGTQMSRKTLMAIQKCFAAYGCWGSGQIGLLTVSPTAGPTVQGLTGPNFPRTPATIGLGSEDPSIKGSHPLKQTLIL